MKTLIIYIKIWNKSYNNNLFRLHRIQIISTTLSFDFHRLVIGRVSKMESVFGISILNRSTFLRMNQFQHKNASLHIGLHEQYHQKDLILEIFLMDPKVTNEGVDHFEPSISWFLVHLMILAETNQLGPSKSKLACIETFNILLYSLFSN